MKRRDFITRLAGAAAWPLAARAQQGDRIRRVGVLFAQAAEDDPDYEVRLAAFVQALRDLGWTEGRNLQLVIHRPKPTGADLRKHIAELVAAPPDVILSARLSAKN